MSTETKNYEEMDLCELINEWQDENKAWHFEGGSGVRKFEELCDALGYARGEFLGSGVSIPNFLADNPGAIDALINWISEQNVDDWKENLISELPDAEAEEDEEKD